MARRYEGQVDSCTDELVDSGYHFSMLFYVGQNMIEHN